MVRRRVSALIVVLTCLLAACGQSAAPTATQPAATATRPAAAASSAPAASAAPSVAASAAPASASAAAATPVASAAAPAAATPAGSAAAGGKVTIQDFFGPVELVANPTKVIAADSVSLGNLLALGVKPIATGVNVNSLPGYLKDQMAGIEVITTADGSGINLERVAALKPDVMFQPAGSAANPFNKDRCTQYKAVAPTFCYEYWYATEDEIKKNLTEIARVLHLETKAQEVIKAYDTRVEALKKRVGATTIAQQQVSVLRVARTQYSLRFGTSESIAFRDLGITQPENQRDWTKFSLVVSLENLDVIQADILFLYVDDNAQDKLAPLTDNPLYKTLPAVKNNRVITVNSGIWNSVDMLGIMKILDDIEQLLIVPAEQKR